MKYPKFVLRTGQLLTWLEKNDKLFLDFRNSYKGIDNKEHWSFLEWKYYTLLKTERMMQRELELGMFVSCDKERKPIKKPGSAPIYTHSKDYIKKYQQAQKEVLFEGWKIETDALDGYYLTYKKDANRAFWISKDNEFELSIGGGFNKIETIEDLIQEIDLIGTESYWDKILKL